MDKNHKVIGLKSSRSALIANTSNYIAEFNLDIGDTIQKLVRAALHFRDTFDRHYGDHDEAKTRGALLTTLRDLVALPDERLARCLENNFPDNAVRALCGLFPAPLFSIEDTDDGVTFIFNDEKVQRLAIKSHMANRWSRGEPSLMRVKDQATGLIAVAKQGLHVAREVMEDWVAEDPMSFRDHCRTTIAKLEKVFQVEGRRGGRNVLIEDGVNAKVEWQLIIDVLDIVWPVENGQLHFKRKEAVESIIDQAKYYAVGDAQPQQGDGKPKLRDKNRDGEVNRELIKDALTLRHQLHAVKDAIRLIEERIDEGRRKRRPSLSRSESAIARENRLYKWAFYPLLDWRREIERRLDVGEYRAANLDLVRPTGPALQLPKMPRITPEMSSSQWLLRLIHAAKPLRGRS